ncbi:MAG: flagellar assembly protein T N-terminal domain-containing protein, partial [Shewanella sp.]
MLMLRSASLITLSLALLSSAVMAQWIEASGEAVIINGNIAQAREEAINQAVSYATLSTGV